MNALQQMEAILGCDALLKDKRALLFRLMGIEAYSYYGDLSRVDKGELDPAKVEPYREKHERILKAIAQALADNEAEIKAKPTESRESKLLREAEIKRRRIRAEKARYEAKINASLEQALADEARAAAERGDRECIIQQAISTGDLKPVKETSLQKTANFQKRSNGGVIRLESGDGK